MTINRNNYEEFFMLYADNELPAAERREVEAFIAANPDLQQELTLFRSFKLSPDATVIFGDKQSLLKPGEGSLSITVENYESFFVLYGDNELNKTEKAAVEAFIYRHPHLQPAFDLLQQARLLPDTHIVFDNKESLHRKEEDDRVVPFRWWRLAAAAMILLLAGIFWMYKGYRRDLVKYNRPAVIKQDPSSQKPGEAVRITTNNHEQLPGEMVAVSGAEKNNQSSKNNQSPYTVKAAVKKENSRGSNNLAGTQYPPAKEDPVVTDDKALQGTIVTSINKPENKTVINTGITAAAGGSVPDKQVTVLNLNEDNTVKTDWASSTGDDDVEVLNTSVNTKNSMRGLLRKASRLIAKKTNLGDENGNRRGILIGGFEIAVR